MIYHFYKPFTLWTLIKENNKNVQNNISVPQLFHDLRVFLYNLIFSVHKVKIH